MRKFKICSFIPVLLMFLATLPAQAQQPHYSLNDELIYRLNFGNPDEVKLLLDKGANPNAISSTKDYAISVALDRDDADAASFLRLLLAKGANPNMRDRSGLYPIVAAVMNNKIQAATALLEDNADYHVKSPNGRTLTDIANQNNNKAMAKLVQDRFDDEARRYAEMRTPERFKMIVHQYVFDSCTYQYWSYVLGSRQEPEKETEITKQANDARTDLMQLAEQIQQYYPNTPKEALKNVSDGAARQIFDTMEGMISNNNRRSHGIGSSDDANSRCQKISNEVNVDFANAALNSPQPGSTPETAHGTKPVR